MGGPTHPVARRGLAITMLGCAVLIAATLVAGTVTAYPARSRGPVPLLGIVCSVLAYLMVMSARQRVSRRRLVAREGRLVAPPRAVLLAAQPSLLTVFLASVVAEIMPDRHGGLPALDIALTLLLAAACVALITPAVLLLYATAAVEIDPHAVVIRLPLARYRIPWAALARTTSGRPALPPGLAPPTVEIPLADPARVARRGIATRTNPMALSLADVDLHPWYLSDVIGYYLDHPGELPRIGIDAPLEPTLRDGDEA